MRARLRAALAALRRATAGLSAEEQSVRGAAEAEEEAARGAACRRRCEAEDALGVAWRTAQARRDAAALDALRGREAAARGGVVAEEAEWRDSAERAQRRDAAAACRAVATRETLEEELAAARAIGDGLRVAATGSAAEAARLRRELDDHGAELSIVREEVHAAEAEARAWQAREGTAAQEILLHAAEAARLRGEVEGHGAVLAPLRAQLRDAQKAAEAAAAERDAAAEERNGCGRSWCSAAHRSAAPWSCPCSPQGS